MSEWLESSRTPEVPNGVSQNRIVVALRSLGPFVIVSIIIIVVGNEITIPLTAILVLIWTKLSHTPWRDLGYVRPRNWATSMAIGILFGVTLKFVMKAIVMPLLGAPPINQSFHFLAGNAAALPRMIYAVTIGAGFGEETIFRGFMFERLGRLFGHGIAAKIAIVLITSALFAAAHYVGQAIPGVEQAFIVGAIFATIFAISGRLFTLMVAHTAFDLTAVWMIYYDLETRVAHLIFK
jgi:membrane protease YdiL (CAAX protease family)